MIVVAPPNRLDNPLRSDLDHVLAHTAPLWSELSGKRVLVTGGTGFVGSWLLESFVWARRTLDLDAEALVLTRSPEAFRSKAPHLASHPGVRLLRGDVRTFGFPDDRCDHVIHAASDASRGRTAADYRQTIDTIVSGTRRVLDLATKHHARKLLFVSSGAVYGIQPPGVSHVAEEYTGAPSLGDAASAYGEAKRLAELMCVIEAGRAGFDATIARGFAFVGPYLPLNASFAIGQFFHDALRGRPPRVSSDGTPRRSYLYTADLAIWLWTILLKGDCGRAYNVGSEADLSLAEVARLVASCVAPELRVEVLGETGAAGEADRYVPKTLRARKELGLREWVGLGDAIRRTVAWHREGNSLRTA